MAATKKLNLVLPTMHSLKTKQLMLTTILAGVDIVRKFPAVCYALLPIAINELEQWS